MSATILSSGQIDTAAALVRQGKVVAFPTDTVYGLAALATLNADSPQRPGLGAMPTSAFLLRAKPERGSPFSLHCGGVDQAMRFLGGLSNGDRHMLETLSPVGVTVILHRRGGSIGVRVVNHPLGSKFLDTVPEPVLATSANRPGEPPLRDPALIAALPGVDAVLDGGVLPERGASTVAKVLPCGLEILRDGAMGRDELAARVVRDVHFVCLGNLNRSAFAHRLVEAAQNWLLERKPGVISLWRVRSSGLVARPDTQPPQPMIEAARACHVDLSSHTPTRYHQESGVSPDLLTVAMGDDVYAQVAGDGPVLNWRVPDPMGGRDRDYIAATVLIARRVQDLLARWAITSDEDSRLAREFEQTFFRERESSFA